MAAVALLLLGLTAYGNSFAGAFVFDDETAIVRNPHIRELWPLTQAITAPPDTTLAGRPLAALTFALNYSLAPRDVRDAMDVDAHRSRPEVDRNLWGYHAVNLAIHITAALLLFGVVRRTLLTPRMRSTYGDHAVSLASAIAGIWLVHPLATGSVTYIVQRVESLMGLFYLLTMYCAVRAHDAAPAVARRWTLAAIAACALGMAAKEVMATAPLMVMLWYWTFEPSGSGRRRWLYGGTCLTWMVLVILATGHPRAYSVGFGFAEWPWWRYLATQAGVVLHYLRLSIVPSPLVLDYEWPPQAALLAGLTQISILASVVATIAWGLWRRSPAAYAGAWTFGILAPTSSVVPIVTEIAAEHRMYLPLAGVVAIGVLAAYRLAQRAPSGERRRTLRRTLAAAAILLIAAFTMMTRARNLDYRDEAHLWADTIAKRPLNARARNNYSADLIRHRQFRQAEDHLRVALAVNPRFAEAHANLGVALCAQDAFDEGIRHLELAVALEPGYADAYRNLGEAYATQGRMAEAVAQYTRALERKPDDVDLLNRIAWILATSPDDRVRDGARALSLAEQAVHLTNRMDAVSLDSLAVSLAETGQFEGALAATREALARAAATGDRDIVPELRGRAALFASHQPFRQNNR